MRARFSGVLGFTVMMLLAGSTSVRAEEAGAITVRAAEVAPPSPWASKPLQKSLFATYAMLQVLDVVSTTHAINSGNGVEANPMVGDLASHPVAFAATKGAMTASTLFLMHRVGKKHPKAAVITMIAFNIGYSYVVSRNFQIAAGR